MLSKRNNAIHQGWLSRKNRSIQRIKKDRPQAVKRFRNTGKYRKIQENIKTLENI